MIRTRLHLMQCCLVLGWATVIPVLGQPGPAGTLAVDQGGGEVRLRLNGGAPFHVTERPVQNSRLVEVPESPVRLVLWEEVLADEQAAPFYAISLDGQRVARVRQTSYVVKLRHGDFEPVSQENVVAPVLSATDDVDLYIVQFATQPLEVFREQIRSLGGTVYSYFPHHGHIVLMSPEVRQHVQTLPYVRWVGPYHPAYRLEEGLGEMIRGPAARRGPQRYRIQVFETGPVQQDLVADRIEEMGGTVHLTSDDSFLMEATLTSAQLLEVARMNQVLFIDRWSPPRPTMNNVRIVGGANYVEGVAGYTGAGVRAEVMDNGCQTDHPDFAGRIAVRGGTGFSAQSHGTATFGIVFGSGAGSANARGMMPDAFGYFNDWNFSGGRYNDLSQLVTSPFNCVFQSNSWGYAPTTQYTSATADLDRAVFDFDIVILNSQGNTGTQSGTEQAWGKNVVGVGGVIHQNDASTGNDFWGGTGTIGPAADGRIKPDLCYYYESIRTTRPTDSYTSSFGGTSAACPETAGHFGLMFQMWADGIFGNPVSGGTVFQERPHSSTARALMYNTADQYTFSGTGHDLTRTHQGWGLADVQNLYDLREKMMVIDETVLVSNLDSVAIDIIVPAGEPALKATLVYTDRQGTTSASQHRINDLSLKVTSPSSTEYWGNNGLLAGNWSTSGGVPNTLDTVENVFIQNPQQGIWKVEVFADELNADGHVETPDLDADFALVVTGVAPDCNTNGVEDGLDIAAGTSEDCNNNGIPDECDEDCNDSGFPDECDITAGTSVDCTGNGRPDECEPDCNSNGVADSCDIALGTSEDCNANGTPDTCDLLSGNSGDCNSSGIPDDCELDNNDCNLNQIPDECDLTADTSSDCNGGGVPDECDISAGTSVDCTANGTPDECEPDCNLNGTADSCDVAFGTSEDCNGSQIPDECELVGNDCNGSGTPDDCERDCNNNGMPDDCDIAGGTSGDCNTNGWADECDVESCTTSGLWDGFQPNPPFSFQTPLAGIDYNGDGFAWDNPNDPPTAIIFPFGCEGGGVFDNAVKIQVDLALPEPEEGYVASEYFLSEDGELPPERQLYALVFRVMLEGLGDAEVDWEFIIRDGTNDAPVVVLRFSSTVSTVTGFPGFITVQNPAVSPAYLDTGVPIVLDVCNELRVALDNANDTVAVYIDGDLKVTTTRYHPDARRMDYFRIQPVLNGVSGHRTTVFRLDRVDLCTTGSAPSPDALPDCNANGVFDECDIEQGTSQDADSNGVPDECAAGTCSDGVLNQGEERIDCGGPCSPCECTSDAACDSGAFCDGTEACDVNGNCQPGSYPCAGDEWCHEGADQCVLHGDGDMDFDLDVDLDDYAALQICFGQAAFGGCEPANMTGIDETIDLNDYAEFRDSLENGL